MSTEIGEETLQRWQMISRVLSNVKTSVQEVIVVSRPLIIRDRRMSQYQQRLILTEYHHGWTYRGYTNTIRKEA